MIYVAEMCSNDNEFFTFFTLLVEADDMAQALERVRAYVNDERELVDPDSEIKNLYPVRLSAEKPVMELE
jgi:hypothetical protein